MLDLRRLWASWVPPGGGWRVAGYLVLGAMTFASVSTSVRGVGFWRGLGGGVFWAAAPFLVGALLGFLFGVPRSVGDDATPAGTPAGPRHRRLRTNTNIERISDWLTTMLVGIGLVELRSLPALLGRCARAAAPAFGSEPIATSVATAVLVSFGVAGFLVGYLFTRLRLSREFDRADEALESAAALVNRSVELPRPGVEKPPAPDPRVAPALQELRGAELSQLTSVEQLRAWARAKAAAGETQAAARALDEAVRMDPRDPGLALEHADVLASAGWFSEAAERFARALGVVRSPDDRVRAVEGLVYSSLYHEGGYRRAVSAGEEFLRGELGSRASPALHAWLACAYGQQHEAAARDSHISSSAAREAALRHVQAAVSDPTWRAILRDSLYATTGDDDLATFRHDAAFTELLGPSVSRG